MENRSRRKKRKEVGKGRSVGEKREGEEGWTVGMAQKEGKGERRCSPEEKDARERKDGRGERNSRVRREGERREADEIKMRWYWWKGESKA